MDGNMRGRSIVSAGALAAALLAVAGVMQSQDDFEIRAQNANCAAMTAEYREAHAREVQAAARAERSELTEQVVRRLGAVRMSLAAPQPEAVQGTIDRRLFEAMRQAGADPAPRTTDIEFIRRVTLDLTGRIPTAERVTQFAALPLLPGLAQ